MKMGAPVANHQIREWLKNGDTTHSSEKYFIVHFVEIENSYCGHDNIVWLFVFYTGHGFSEPRTSDYGSACVYYMCRKSAFGHKQNSTPFLDSNEKKNTKINMTYAECMLCAMLVGYSKWTQALNRVYYLLFFRALDYKCRCVDGCCSLMSCVCT